MFSDYLMLIFYALYAAAPFELRERFDDTPGFRFID